jgi:hypothetical protein
MARWKLTEPHYLNVPGNEWEQVVNDPVTQRPIRKKFPVPTHLDPRVVDDWNHKSRDGMDGEITVAWKDKGEPGDIIFVGPPTPGMLPLDDEARAESAKFSWTATQTVSDGWIPDETTESGKILGRLMKQLADSTVSAPQAPAGFEKFMEAMAQMMQQQTMLLQKILDKNAASEFEAQAKALGAEPAVNLDEELPDAEEPTEEELAEAARVAAAKEAASQAKAQAHVGMRRV